MEEKCRWIITKPNTKICGKQAARSITMGNISGNVKVPLCEEHIAEHNRRAASIRASKK